MLFLLMLGVLIMGEKLTKKGVSKPASKKRNPAAPVRRSAPTTKEPTPETIAIGERIAAILASRGLQRSVVAERAGIAEATVGHRIQGLATHKWVDLSTFARALGVTPNEILGFSTVVDDRLLHKYLANGFFLAQSAGKLSHSRCLVLVKILLAALRDLQSAPGAESAEKEANTQAEGAVRLFLSLYDEEPGPKNAS
jgi:transcriptional regulator with XRE-family HTH domain